MTTAQRVGLVLMIASTAAFWGDSLSPYKTIYLGIIFIGTVLFVQRLF